MTDLYQVVRRIAQQAAERATAPLRDMWSWAIVTAADPLRISIEDTPGAGPAPTMADLDATELPYSPVTLAADLQRTDRVLTLRIGGQLIVLGRRGGPQDRGPIGGIIQWPSSVLPPGWLWCDGSPFYASDYPKLAALIGTTFGGTSANPLVPKVNGRVPVGRDQYQTEFDTLGEVGGAKTHTLAAGEMPTHAHTMGHTHPIDPPATNTAASEISAYRAPTSAAPDSQADPRPTANMSGAGSVSRPLQGSTHSHPIDIPAFTSGASSAANTGSAGSGGAHNNLQPYIVLNYIIKGR